MHEFCEDYERMFENIVASAYTYVAASKVESLVIGMSGGIDSTITAAIAREVIDRLNTGITLDGNIIDIESDPSEMERARRAAAAFCDCDYYCVSDFNEPYKVVASNIMKSDYKRLIRRGNIKARLRMIKLYDLANEMDGLVLSTDNYTEYLLGFWTLHGDVGDFGMIQNLWKTEVYGLTEYLAGKLSREGKHSQADSLIECIDAMPTDGLGVTNSDFDQIYPGHSKNKSPREIYEEIDTMLGGYLNHPIIYPSEVKIYGKDIIDRHKATKFKRNNPFSIPREYIVKELA